MLQFNRLRTKLTVLYAGLFSLISLVVVGAVYVAASDRATRQTREELQANGEVFDRLWQMRSAQLRDSAEVLARDFGFRDAIASGDAPTILSALDNLRQRLKLDRAFFLDIDGDILGASVDMSAPDRKALWRALDETPDAGGVLMINGVSYQAIAAPVLAPDTLGWVVFASALDNAQMRSFEGLAAIPINAQVFTRDGDAAWRARAAMNPADARDYARLLSGPKDRPQFLNLKQGRAIALALPLPVMSGAEEKSAALVLSYPLALALAQYRFLVFLIAGIGAMGLGLVLWGSWFLARSLTHPVTLLDDAAHRLQQGEEVQVSVASRDEIGRLAESFNVMAAGIKQREKRIQQMALTDSEVRLPNRRAFENALSKKLAKGAGFVVLVVGIDRFQHVRGAVGYELSAALVQALGERLAAMRPKVHAARIATDSLGVILNSTDTVQVLDAAQNILTILEAPLMLQSVALDVSTTIGLSESSSTRDAAALINWASVAVDQGRKAHHKISYFDAAAYGDPSRNLALISELYAGMEQGHVFLLHQPKYDIRTRQIVGAEALMRWRHPERGMISPDLFITTAEETGNIRGVTEWVLDRAIADQTLMRAAGHDVTISVNVSGRLLSEPSFANFAIRRIRAANAAICFEITETAIIDNPEAALLVLERLSEAGIKISIDDYGSGLSSLSYLKQIRAQELKIDKNFILSLDSSPRDYLMVKSTVDLAHSLGMRVVAEGIETEAVLAVLASMGCDVAQGYLIGRPMSVPEFIDKMSVFESQTGLASLPLAAKV